MSSAKAGQFSILLTTDQDSSFKIQKYSILNAVKPLVYFASIFGLKIIKYLKSDIQKTGVINRVYSSIVILTISILTAFIPPNSWRYTISDVPLNIMTKAYGSLHVIEVLYSILSISITRNKFFAYLFKTIDDVDNYVCVKKKVFYFRVILAFLLMLWPFLAMMLCTLFLRPFNVKDMAAYISVFMLIVEGCILYFVVTNIYFHIFMFNEVLLREKVSNLSQENKVQIFERRVCQFLLRVSCKKRDRYCWFELMKIYDKISDSVYLFNEIYSIQILIMFVIWFMCTLLVICRYLSPSLPRYDEVFLNDLFLYTIINSRPIFLAKMCELFIAERKRTLTILMHILLHEESGNLYYEQVQTMFELVESRKLDISAEVFIVNVPIVLSFAGKAISYGVLMIQYFYMHNEP